MIMKNKITLFLIVLLFSSCSLFKKVSKNESESISKEQITTKSVRVGDTVSYQVPLFKYKDTTIYSINKVGTRIETRFDEEGNVDLINCFSSTIEDLRSEIRELKQKDSSKEKEEEGKPDKWFWFLIVIAAGIVLVVIKKM